jgi:hypothetical protein
LEQLQYPSCRCLSSAHTHIGRDNGGQGYANAEVTQIGEDDLAEQALGAFANLATATAVDRGVVAQLTESNSRLAKQLEDNATALKEVSVTCKRWELGTATSPHFHALIG